MNIDYLKLYHYSLIPSILYIHLLPKFTNGIDMNLWMKGLDNLVIVEYAFSMFDNSLWARFYCFHVARVYLTHADVFVEITQRTTCCLCRFKVETKLCHLLTSDNKN